MAAGSEGHHSRAEAPLGAAAAAGGVSAGPALSAHTPAGGTSSSHGEAPAGGASTGSKDQDPPLEVAAGSDAAIADSTSSASTVVGGRKDGAVAWPQAAAVPLEQLPGIVAAAWALHASALERNHTENPVAARLKMKLEGRKKVGRAPVLAVQEPAGGPAASYSTGPSSEGGMELPVMLQAGSAAAGELRLSKSAEKRRRKKPATQAPPAQQAEQLEATRLASIVQASDNLGSKGASGTGSSGEQDSCSPHQAAGPALSDAEPYVASGAGGEEEEAAVPELGPADIDEQQVPPKELAASQQQSQQQERQQEQQQEQQQDAASTPVKEERHAGGLGRCRKAVAARGREGQSAQQAGRRDRGSSGNSRGPGAQPGRGSGSGGVQAGGQGSKGQLQPQAQPPTAGIQPPHGAAAAKSAALRHTTAAEVTSSLSVPKAAAPAMVPAWPNADATQQLSAAPAPSSMAAGFAAHDPVAGQAAERQVPGHAAAEGGEEEDAQLLQQLLGMLLQSSPLPGHSQGDGAAGLLAESAGSWEAPACPSLQLPAGAGQPAGVLGGGQPQHRYLLPYLALRPQAGSTAGSLPGQGPAGTAANSSVEGAAGQRSAGAEACASCSIGFSAVDAHEDEDLCCPITMVLMRNPVMAADGFTYERAAIEAWLGSHDTSPVTNLPLPHKGVVANRFASTMIRRRLEGS